jgi:hydroxypyruvate isomerase
MKRRSFVKTVAGITIIGSAGKLIFAQSAEQIEALSVKGNIRQSVSKWCFGKIPLDDFCKICKKLGMVGVDLIGEKDWDTVNKNDMIVTMGSGMATIPDGFNRIENHEKLIADYERVIPIAAEKKVPNIICFSGNRNGMDDELGLENCVIGLKKLMPTAEKYKVNVVMELLNSKNHKDYMADTTPWGGTLARKVGSERFKLLYDIFHLQRMEGDLIQMIRDYKDVIGHYHTGGNPGRNDIDETQEIYYPAVMKAIVETGYKGFVAHEFIPKDGLNSLRKAVQICDV